MCIVLLVHSQRSMVCIQQELNQMTIRSTDPYHHPNERAVDVGPPIGVEPMYRNAAANAHTTAGSSHAATSNLCHTGNWMPSVGVGGGPNGAFGTSATGVPYGKSTTFMDFLGCMRPFFPFAFKSSAGGETDGRGGCGGGGVGGGSGGGAGSNYKRDQWEIPFEEILELEWVGSGAQGTVFSGKLLDEIVAVKKVRDLKETDIRHLRKLDHENIIKFK